MIDWRNKKIAVLGLGVEGVSSAKFLIRKGAIVTVLDKKREEELEKDIKILRYKDIKIVTGENYLKSLDKFEVIVRSPGVKRNLPEILEAEKKGTTITSQAKIFFDLCPCSIIGVTGTKGKGTTATLIYEMLKKSFDSPSTSSGQIALDKHVYLGGNIGKSPFEFLDKLNRHSWVVLELSSFQLQDLTKSPHIAVVLMITSEHLDYHKDVYEYVDAKRNILRFQKESDFTIINRDYPASNESDIHTNAQVFQVSKEREVYEKGCFVRDGVVWVRKAGEEKKIISTKNILLPGKHNLENVCAAVMAATIAGVPKENIVKVLKTFKGLEHRLELVGKINGVKYYDDSFSTTPETAIAAIQAFKAPEILILGGSSKGSDFTELGKIISDAKNVKVIIGIGVEWQKIKLKVKSEKLKVIEGLRDMRQIVKRASETAEHGDVVLLSPACASFDMFKNYKDRGEQFKKQVKMLKKSTD